MLEAKTKDQGHRRKRSPKKKRSSNIFFQAISNSLAYPEFLIGGGLNHKSHEMNDVIKIFPRRKFLWDKDIVGWKIRNRCCLFAHNQDFTKEEGLYLYIYFTKAKPPAVGRFFVIFWMKKAILMPLDHISLVFRVI